MKKKDKVIGSIEEYRKIYFPKAYSRGDFDRKEKLVIIIIPR